MLGKIKMSLDEETNAKREKINAMKNKIIINESDSDSIAVTGEEKNKLKVNEQDKKKVKLSELDLLTPDEKQQLEAQKGKTDDEEENKGKVSRGGGDRAKADWKRDKLIEYTDIIDFLFKEIVIEGLDWSLNKVVNTVTFGTVWAIDSVIKTAKYGKDRLWENVKEQRQKLREKAQETPQAQNAAQKPQDRTQSFTQTVQSIHSQNLPLPEQSVLTDENKKLIEGIAGIIRRGEYHNLKFMSPETMDILQKADPQKLNEILSPDNMKTFSATMLYTTEIADLYSTNMATARMLTAKAKDADAYNGTDEQKVHEMLKLEARKEFSELINQAAQNGQNIPETVEDYFKTSLKAKEHITSEIQKGNYQENGKQPADNPYLQQIEKDVAAAKDKPYEAQTGLIEMAEEMVSRQENLSAVKENLEKREALIEARKADLTKRREQLRQACAKTKNPLLAEKARTGSLNAQQISLDQQAFQQMRKLKEQTK